MASVVISRTIASGIRPVSLPARGRCHTLTIEHVRDCGGEPQPARGFGFELAAAGSRELVESRPPAGLGDRPRRGEPAAAFHPVERSLLDAEHVLGQTLETDGDGVSME